MRENPERFILSPSSESAFSINATGMSVRMIKLAICEVEKRDGKNFSESIWKINLQLYILKIHNVTAEFFLNWG